MTTVSTKGPNLIVVTIALALVVSVAALDEVAAAALRARLAEYAGSVQAFAAEYAQRFDSSTATCGQAFDLCPGALAVGAPSPFGSVADFSTVRVVTSTPPLSNSSTAAQRLQQNCAVSGLRTLWAQQHAAANATARWRYVATPENMFGVWPQPRLDCAAAPYTPRARPYFNYGLIPVAHAVAIVIDVSLTERTTERVFMSVVAAKGVLGLLTPRDHVALALYAGEVALTPTLNGTTASPAVVAAFAGAVPATDATRAAIAAFLDTLTADREYADERTDMTLALERGYALVRAAPATACMRSVALITSGMSTQRARDVDALVAANGGVPVYAMIADAAQAAPKLLAATLACSSRGLLTIAADLAGAEGFAWAVQRHIVSQYLPGSAAASRARWTPWYTDAFGEGAVATVVVPVAVATNGGAGVTVVRAMAALDVPRGVLEGVAPGLSAADVEAVIAATEVCPARRPVLEVPRAVQGTACAYADQAVEGERLEVKRLFGLWVVLSLVFVFLATGLMACGFMMVDSAGGASIGCGISLVCYLIALSIFWAMTWPDLVKTHYYVAVEYVAEQHEENPFRCCEKVGCSCTEQLSSAPRCSALLSRLEEGECGDGYHCCRSESYDCNCRNEQSCTGSGSDRKCRTVRRCSTCTRCVSSVSNRACSVACGTCFRPTVIVTYEYKGQQVLSQFSTYCGRDQFTCKDNFLAEMPVGQRQTGYVNPEDPKEIHREVGVRKAPMAFAIIFSVIAFGTNLVGICLATKGACENVSCAKASSSSDQEMAARSASQRATNSPKGNEEACNDFMENDDDETPAKSPKEEPVVGVPLAGNGEETVYSKTEV